MSNISLFHFNGSHNVRVITENGGEPRFVACDVCAALDIDPTAMRKLDTDEKGLHSMQTLGGTQKIAVVTEAGMYTLALRCRDALVPGTRAYRFRKWVTTEVLPSIRKTGGYRMSASGQDSAKLTGALAIAECFTRMLKPAPSCQVAMLEHIAKDYGINPGFLPSYVIDAAPDSASGSSMETKPLTDLLKIHGIDIRACAYNRHLEDAGFLSRNTRRSTSAAGGMKQYWAVTEAGLRYGKNVTNPGNPRETQPHWYVERFTQMHRTVAAGGPCHDALPMPMEIAA